MVSKCIETILLRINHVRDVEGLLESLQEWLEEEVLVDVLSNVVRQLVVVLDVLVFSEGLVAVVLPLELEIRLKFNFKIVVQALVFVESCENTKEFVQVITLV